MPTLMDHIQFPRNRGGLNAPDAVGLAGTPGRGPYLVLYLKIEDDRVTDARYQSEGCGPTIASGSILTELIIGRTIDECRTLTTDHIVDELGEFPPHKQHCPGLAISALQQALDDWSRRIEEGLSGRDDAE